MFDRMVSYRRSLVSRRLARSEYRKLPNDAVSRIAQNRFPGPYYATVPLRGRYISVKVWFTMTTCIERK
jgi:hypothetical protein